MQVEITAEQLSVLQDVVFAISTPDAEPVLVACEPADETTRHRYNGGPDGHYEFVLSPVLDEDALHAFEAVVRYIEQQLSVKTMATARPEDDWL